VRGEGVQFSLRMTLPGAGFTHLAFVGRARGDTIEGTADASIPMATGDDEEAMEHVRMSWLARRAKTVGYFAPTGTDIA
jgi:hypothetical protein